MYFKNSLRCKSSSSTHMLCMRNGPYRDRLLLNLWFLDSPLTRPRTDFRSAPGSTESLGFGNDNSDVALKQPKQTSTAMWVLGWYNVDKLHDFPGWFSLQFTSFHMISYGKTLYRPHPIPPKKIMTLRELT